MTKLSYAWATFQSNPGFSRYRSLIAKKADPSEVFRAVYDAVMEIVQGVQKGTRYSCEDLCGDALWNRHPSKGQRRALGIALKHLIDQGALPLICVTPTQNNKFYTIKE